MGENLQRLASRGVLSGLEAPAPEVERARFLERLGAAVPDDYVRLLAETNGFEIGGFQFLGTRARRIVFVEIWRANTSLPTHHMLGNHDPAGWGAGEVPEDHPDYAFGLMQRVLGLPRRHYSFDHGGWHFVVVDNVHLTTPGKHIGYVGEEQLAWLSEDLRLSRGRPAIVAMHVPPLTAVEFLTSRAGQDEEKGQWRIGFDRMSRNPGELLAALGEGNVRAILCGPAVAG